MRYEYDKDLESVTLKEFDSFDAGQTLECGQCFRYVKQSDSRYSVIAHKKTLNIEHGDGAVVFSPCGPDEFKNIWINYFDFNTDYSKIKRILTRDDEVMERAVEHGGGIRLLHQDKWEVLISFIISQNKRIPQIQKIVGDICEKYGDEIPGGYAFPDAQSMKDVTVDDLLELKTGFRAKYIIDAIKKIKSGELDFNALEGIETEEIREKLMSIKGIGPKVANCALLYSFNKRDSFPVDTWIKKAMEKFYFGGETVPIYKIQKFAAEKFGEYGGYAQQYLFHYIRMIGNAKDSANS